MRNWKTSIFILILFTGCKKLYNPPTITAPNSYLVVEGVINSGPDATTIKLSHTVNIASNITLNPVNGAVLTVESDQSAVYPLAESQIGVYTANGLNLDNSHKYRLRIKTANEEYLSDFVTVENSPPIDSVNFVIQRDGLNIYSNTHDANNNTKYYRWDYEETWIIHSQYDSFFKSNGDDVVQRDYINDQIYTCWTSTTSSTIILNSSAKLARDVIVNNPIIFIPSTSEKLSSKYSILVKQYALSGNAYAFWQNLKKNTEQLGSIFDAQPSQISGNIHSTTNPSEPVIGYISVGSVSSARIFIANQQLPAWADSHNDPTCKLDTFYFKYIPPGSTTPINQVDLHINYNKGATNPEIPVLAISPPGSPPIGYTASEPVCVDCTLRGTNVKPSFWK
ncbi:DUF4249 domain-containing protein [Mucilaginibacter gotjawali]|uniref:DUF4249 domain-containing protein n=1 Tax=Mucilaginibacter gotjawali TaxID=1550579 RepID=A0A839SIP2_9SPHI|nr:DUF4249 domain-containing protein [Mucilaginibacter gotjawali]MBB3057163.1 hypothetical protein [Mucilaginibacter gotjawali]